MFYPCNPVSPRRLPPSVLAFSLSLHRYPSICILFNPHFTVNTSSRDNITVIINRFSFITVNTIIIGVVKYIRLSVGTKTEK